VNSKERMPNCSSLVGGKKLNACFRISSGTANSPRTTALEEKPGREMLSALSMDIERIVKKCEKIRPHLAALFAPSENDIPALQAQWQVNASYIAALQKDASSAIRRKLVKAVNEIRAM